MVVIKLNVLWLMNKTSINLYLPKYDSDHSGNIFASIETLKWIVTAHNIM